MKSKILIGWVGKSEKPFIKYNRYGDLHSNIYKTKDSREDWLEKDWPPKKVKVTITIEEI